MTRVTDPKAFGRVAVLLGGWVSGAVFASTARGRHERPAKDGRAGGGNVGSGRAMDGVAGYL